MCKDALNESRKSGDKASFSADDRGVFLFHCNFCSSTPCSAFYYLPSCLFFLSRAVRESSISGSCKIHLITAAFLHLLPLNHSPFLYFIRFFIPLYTSHYLPHHYSLSHSLSSWPFVFLLLCATTHIRFLDTPFLLVPTILTFLHWR